MNFSLFDWSFFSPFEECQESVHGIKWNVCYKDKSMSQKLVNNNTLQLIYLTTWFLQKLPKKPKNFQIIICFRVQFDSNI